MGGVKNNNLDVYAVITLLT